MTLSLTSVFILEKSIKSLFLLAIIFLARPILNKKAFRSASIILWIVLLIYLVSPYELEIGIESVKGNSVLFAITNFIDYSLGWLANEIVNIFFKLNRLIGSILIFTYLGIKIYKFHTVMKGSTLTHNTLCEEKIREFGLKRKVEIYINNNLKTPLTFDILKPKIILQDHILADEKLLDHVLIHELMHIRKFHILLNHMINIVACLYWFNPLLWLSLKYLDQDIEINCDKLVVENLGDTIKNRKEYCISMLKLLEIGSNTNNFALKLNPNKERILIMKQWKKTLTGLVVFISTFTFCLPVFANVTDLNQDRIDTKGEIVNNINSEFGDGVQIISDEEYQKLELGEVSRTGLRAANVDENIRLSRFDKIDYEFNMDTWTGKVHDGFTVRLKDMSCSGGVDYSVIIEENGKIIYDKRFASDSILKVKANRRSNYIVTIVNRSNKTLTGNVKINSYVR
ncbi:peptidase M56 [Aerococcus mictus]|uniref:Peptidase, M56 family n=1 Tax=Peptoniphilus harei TaxID=54005 RepID=A0A133PR13_9FIRM|nr:MULTISPECIES: M56 family metallopeptidase [Bacillota]KXA31089.1 peptidase, M56 family [Peptoniphilus harei]RAV73872.1 peptidase M56 [Aerococcus mictus]HEQ4075177.1 M56 family metallopeptidase [Streptococcus pyogenes]